MAFSKLETMGSVIQDIQPDIIINAAAYTIVDRGVEPELFAKLTW